MIPKRTDRIGELIKREISGILLHDLRDPKLGFVTVSKVTVTKDLKQANIWISVLGDDSAQRVSIEIIGHARNRIKELLAPRLRLKFMPNLRFHLDTFTEYNARMGAIISKLRHEEGWENER